VIFPAEEVNRTIADGLRTSPVGEIPFEHLRRYVDDIVTVSEDEIRAAMRHIMLSMHIVAEPSGAVAPAALLYHRAELPPASKVVAVLSGGNVATEMLTLILQS
jgi:threo-3-hydroxy-L-aspartate ammonia-lyase